MTMAARVHLVLPTPRRLAALSHHVHVAFQTPARQGPRTFWSGAGLPTALILSAMLWALIAALIV